MNTDRDNKGKFTKGNKGKPKGALNKSSERIRLAYAKLLEDNLDTLTEDVQSLKSKERARFMLDLSKYIIPTLKATELDISEAMKETLKLTPEQRDAEIERLMKKLNDKG